eukprot:CAMPEP_0194205028 /NCGR_PEP_ID=MMETSP0156-20130528/4385_1 /TAXON_ID=33649 /ORGANISM="Thalassionema nitzschioides, Strain L26-B" /LENGTH=261 /DNA_ID=CAMNT_0038931181 /DNA_START=279 /DNA_END=1067 /DNA_ORIENTATION=-
MPSTPPPEDMEESSTNSVAVRINNNFDHYCYSRHYPLVSILSLVLGSFFFLLVSILDLNGALQFFGPIFYLLCGLCGIFQSSTAPELRIATHFAIASLWDFVSVLAQEDTAQGAKTAFFFLAAHFYMLNGFGVMYQNIVQKYEYQYHDDNDNWTTPLRNKQMAFLGDSLFLFGTKIKVGIAYAMILDSTTFDSTTSEAVLGCAIATAACWLANALIVLYLYYYATKQQQIIPKLPPGSIVLEEDSVYDNNNYDDGKGIEIV